MCITSSYDVTADMNFVDCELIYSIGLWISFYLFFYRCRSVFFLVLSTRNERACLDPLRWFNWPEKAKNPWVSLYCVVTAMALSIYQ